MLVKIFVYTIDKRYNFNVVIINHNGILFYGLLVDYLFLDCLIILGFCLGIDGGNIVGLFKSG
jgi:hypothetical protein